uniref:Ankyrin repeat domain-containing protein 50-like n=1 Tax=Geotrypetes seraphini TaxID=260995 RepID=A0A6P8RLD7_GEOSA|nr:ankyrin repeat domain-containing protein 50-like [Geotrypetes seraphini]XP_033806166.1 ankyrin repeat domain-containing protein 50-like [Geotrypetes seraphini]XP_033806167.1 ankyrin repeat domain-containing protein 50-like [Geotrypetes seraphini]XP_033806168.1 ankyrin repeat domain-containing protein 50-like [Geotrypetes seraphini]
MSESLLRGKPFYCREWALQRLQHCLEGHGSGSHSALNSGVLITGGLGSGKSALCTEVLWPTSEQGRKVQLSGRVVGYHFCQAYSVQTLSVREFILRLVEQIQRCPLIQGYGQKLHDPAAQSVLNPSECERDPDEAFKRAVLLPLLDLQPPSQNLLLLVDSVDESSCFKDGDWKLSGKSQSIAELLSNHQELFPSWLLLVCSARRQNRFITKMFPGFRRLCLDDLRKAHIVKDVQQYILCRLDQEMTLRQHLTRETAEMLNQLHIKSNGCFLYLERVLDGVSENFIVLREIRDIPGTLNGLYLWLCQRLFTRKQFARVQPLLNILLAAYQPLTVEELFRALWTRNMNPSAWGDFQRKLESLSKLLVDGPNHTKLLFHHSFADWLLDVKYCTQKYLCNAAEGHGMLAMSLSSRAQELQPTEVHQYAQHLLHSNLQLDLCHFALWMVWSGAPVAGCLSLDLPVEQEALQLLVKAGACITNQDADTSCSFFQRALEREDSIRMLLENGASISQKDSNGRTLLAGAAHSGNLEVMTLLISRGADIEEQDNSGQTPLTLAARQGHNKVLHCLIAHEANVNHSDLEGWTALRSAAWGGHSEAVVALLRAGADVDSTDADNRTALRAAAWGGHEDIVLTLLQHGAEVNKVDTEGRTALIAAAYMGHREIVELLLAHEADINHKDMDGRTALSVAALCVPASQGYADVVSLLLEHGAEVGHRDQDGMTPLLVAAYEGHADVVDLLLEGGADVDDADATGRTPLLAAASMGHTSVVNTLLFWGAAVDTIDSEGRTVLSIAAAQGNESVVQTLLDRGLDENHRDDMGWTPLHMAAFEGHIIVCRALVKQGARVTEMDNDGRIPLILAAQEGHSDCVKLLLDSKSPIDARGYDGRSALCVAALEGHKTLAELLLRKGADVNLRDSDGRPMTYLLVLENLMEMVELLLENGANLETRDPDGRTALHVSCWQGYMQMVRLLVRYGADVSALDHERRSALHSAAWQGHPMVVEFLIECGANVDHQCNQGATSLCIAAQEGHTEVVRMLLEKGADPVHADQYGRMPMRVAAKHGHMRIMKLLERYGAPAYNGPLPNQQTSTVKTQSSVRTSNSSGSPSTLGGEVPTSSDKKPPPSSSPSMSPESTVDRCKSLVSENSVKSSQSSSILTSSTYHSLATAQTVPVDSLNFTQQIQQHSLPRSLHSVVSPGSTLRSCKAKTSPQSTVSESLSPKSLQNPSVSSSGLSQSIGESPRMRKGPPTPVKMGLASVPEKYPKTDSPGRVSAEKWSSVMNSLGVTQVCQYRDILTNYPSCGSPDHEMKRNGILTNPKYSSGGSPSFSPQKLSSSGVLKSPGPEPLISITTLDPQLNLKQAIKLQFEGPTSGFSYKKETPL